MTSSHPTNQIAKLDTMAQEEKKMDGRALVYGAYGYSGVLITKRCIELGCGVVVAGRTKDKCVKLVQELGLDEEKDMVVFGVDDEGELDKGLQQHKDVKVVMNCAGPFTRTFDAMAKGCLRNKLHYLDITGEIQVFEAAAKLNEEAKEAGVMFMPGTGFDVVPSDCLAKRLSERLPGGHRLELAFHGVGAEASHGTMTTMLENAGGDTLARRNGKIVTIDYCNKKIPFTNDEKIPCTAIPWGDVSTAYYSTGCHSVTTYIGSPGGRNWGMWLLSFGLFKWAVGSLSESTKKKIIPEWGPTKEQRDAAYSLLWGEITHEKSCMKATSRLRCSEGYNLTALASAEVVRRVLQGVADNPENQGFRTPSLVFGSDFILECDPNAKFEDVEEK